MILLSRNGIALKLGDAPFGCRNKASIEVFRLFNPVCNLGCGRFHPQKVSLPLPAVPKNMLSLYRGAEKKSRAFSYFYAEFLRFFCASKVTVRFKLKIVKNAQGSKENPHFYHFFKYLLSNFSIDRYSRIIIHIYRINILFLFYSQPRIAGVISRKNNFACLFARFVVE